MYLFVLKPLFFEMGTFLCARTCVKHSKKCAAGQCVQSHKPHNGLPSVTLQASVGFKIISIVRSYGFHSSGVNGAESDGVALGLVALVLGLFVGCHWPGANDPAVVDAASR